MFPVDFPDDKTELIPAMFELIAIIIVALLAVRFFIYISKRELKKAELIEMKAKELTDPEHHDKSTGPKL